MLDVAERFVRENNLNTIFQNEWLGEDWFSNFKRKHGLSLKTKSLQYARKKATQPHLAHGNFKLLKQALDNLDLHDKP